MQFLPKLFSLVSSSNELETSVAKKTVEGEVSKATGSSTKGERSGQTETQSGVATPSHPGRRSGLPSINDLCKSPIRLQNGTYVTSRYRGMCIFSTEKIAFVEGAELLHPENRVGGC